jgi:hypothetical protein
MLASAPPFDEALGAWVLLGRPVSTSTGQWAYRTASFDQDLFTTSSGVQVIVSDDDVVFPVKKRPGATAFSTTVLLGRSDSNDIVIPHASVSKLHARLEVGVAGQVTLSDSSSSNGTKIGDAVIAEGERRVLTSGVRLTFGACTFLLCSVDELARIVTRDVRSRA